LLADATKVGISGFSSPSPAAVTEWLRSNVSRGFWLARILS
jgi:hypothetical protein